LLNYYEASQFFGKIITFVMNIFILRKINPTLKGEIFRIELVNLSVLSLSREGIRRTCRRLTNVEDVYAASLISVPLGILLSILFYSCYYIYDDHPALGNMLNVGAVATAAAATTTTTTTTTTTAAAVVIGEGDKSGRWELMIFFVSILVEILSEPSQILCNHMNLYAFRAKLESFALIIKLGYLYQSLSSFSMTTAPAASTVNFFRLWSYSNLLFALLIFFGYFFRALEIVPLHQHFIIIKNYFHYYFHYYGNETTVETAAADDDDDGCINVAVVDNLKDPDRRIEVSDPRMSYRKILFSFWAQSLLKFVLAEGEKMFLLFFTSASDQGVYDLASNLGSLVARLFFQPLEELTNQIWSSNSSSSSQSSNAFQQKQLEQDPQRWQLLQMILRVLVIFGFFSMTFGPIYSRDVIVMVYGIQWEAAGPLLSAYSYYIIFLGVNGVMESYVQARATQEELNQYSRRLLAFFAMWIAALLLFIHVLHLGPISFILANILNMSFRIYFSYRFIMHSEHNILEMNLTAKDDCNKDNNGRMLTSGGNIVGGRWTSLLFIAFSCATAHIAMRMSSSSTDQAATDFIKLYLGLPVFLPLLIAITVFLEKDYVLKAWKR